MQARPFVKEAIQIFAYPTDEELVKIFSHVRFRVLLRSILTYE